MPTRGKRIRSERSNAVLYARVSDPEQAEKDLSLPAQLEAMREYARSHGLNVVQVYVEPGVTARDDNRVEFRRMMERVLAPECRTGTILVLHTSRFMRNAFKAKLWKGRLEKLGIRVVAIRQEVTDDASGHLMENVFEAFDQYESEIIGERVSLGMRQNAKQGYFNPTFRRSLEPFSANSAAPHWPYAEAGISNSSRTVRWTSLN
jgi:site-specific DNA recombinase